MEKKTLISNHASIQRMGWRRFRKANAGRKPRHGWRRCHHGLLAGPQVHVTAFATGLSQTRSRFRLSLLAVVRKGAALFESVVRTVGRFGHRWQSRVPSVSAP